MPTYDYVCPACGHEMEVVHPVHGHGPSECPRCGGAMRKAYRAPAVHFKGTGWARKERSGSSRPRTETKDTPSTEPKPATGSDTGSSSGTPGTSGSSESA